MFQCKQGRIDSGLQTEAPSAIPHSNWGRAPRDKFTSPSWPTLAHGEDLGWFISSGYKAGARKARSLVQVQGEEQGRELNWLCAVVTDCVSALSECLVHSWKECGVWAAGSWPVGHTAIFKLVLQDCNLHGLWVPDGQGDSLVWPLSCGTHLCHVAVDFETGQFHPKLMLPKNSEVLLLFCGASMSLYSSRTSILWVCE